MRWRPLGPSGTRVSVLCLGMLNFRLNNEDEAVTTVREAIDGGVNFIDTANVYTSGESEIVTGRALKGVRDEIVLATKFVNSMNDADPNARGASRRSIKMQCEASLRRLGTDRIDLYQQHRPDPDTPIEETLQALDDLVREGKVHYVGLSNFPAWQVMEAIAVSEARDLASRPITEQPPYNILDRRVEAELAPLALGRGLGLLPWSPLASGILTGKYSGGVVADGTRATHMPQIERHPNWLGALDVADQLVTLARDGGLTPVQLALGWLIGQPAVVAPIVGPRDSAQLRENLAAADVEIPDDIRAAIDALAPPHQAVFRLS